MGGSQTWGDTYNHSSGFFLSSHRNTSAVISPTVQTGKLRPEKSARTEPGWAARGAAAGLWPKETRLAGLRPHPPDPLTPPPHPACRSQAPGLVNWPGSGQRHRPLGNYGKQSQVCVDSAPTCSATFWRRQNPSGSSGPTLSPFCSWQREPKTRQAGLAKILCLVARASSRTAHFGLPRVGSARLPRSQRLLPRGAM